MALNKSRWVGIVWCVGMALGGAVANAQSYRHFEWNEVASGVWFGTPQPTAFQGGNVAIVTLPSGGALVVDTQNSAYLGQEILDKAKELGKGPVKYVVNTHLHQDHVGGNVVFRQDNPTVDIMAHKNTCQMIPQKTIPRMHDRLPGIVRGLEAMKAKRATLPDGDKAAQVLDYQIKGTELYLADTRDFKWELPNVCLDFKAGDAKVITDGGRRIEIRYFGRLHSSGDLLVFLPQEKVAIVGDLWHDNTGFPFTRAGLDGREGSMLEAATTQRAIRALDFRVALSGHSPGPMQGKTALDTAIAYNDQFIGQIKAAVDTGKTVVGVLDRMPMPENMGPFHVEAWKTAVIRAYEEIELRRQLGIPLPGEGSTNRP